MKPLPEVATPYTPIIILLDPLSSPLSPHTYQHLLMLVEKRSINKTTSIHSKKWWDQEVTTQLQKCRHAPAESFKEESKALQKLIRYKKRACWAKFLEEQGHCHPWNVARIAKDPFHCRQACGDLTDSDNITHSLDSSKCELGLQIPQLRHRHPT
ncbi:hypothetical protein EV426DRAFT_706330 [Tirmania nivea]|nr:hypothetical protein EV426DRAFT_706330 [Tirmania nivea]